MFESPYKNKGLVNVSFETFSKCNTSNEILTIRNYITRNPFRCFAYPHPSRTGNQAKSGSGASGPKVKMLIRSYEQKNAHLLSADKTSKCPKSRPPRDLRNFNRMTCRITSRIISLETHFEIYGSSIGVCNIHYFIPLCFDEM